METYYRTEESNICYVTHHQEKSETIVLIHGFGITKEMWNRQLHDLWEYQVITLDVAHHGKKLMWLCENIDTGLRN